MKSKSRWLIKPHTKVNLDKLTTDADGGLTQETAAATLAGHRDRLSRLQEVLYANQSRAVLVVLQGMDTAGKDGTISHIFSGVNPQGCDVASFKTPTLLEAHHDFLWRCHQQAPALGMIQIFNRSHYEQALFPRVHKTLKPKQVRKVLDDINAFESTLYDQGTVILKFFLHISHKEQTQRLQARIEDPDKHWKFSPADLAERKFWDDYTDAYEDILSHTSHKHAPWFVIPSDHKWYRNVAISEILAEAIQSLNLKYPEPVMDVSKIKL